MFWWHPLSRVHSGRLCSVIGKTGRAGASAPSITWSVKRAKRLTCLHDGSKKPVAWNHGMGWEREDCKESPGGGTDQRERFDVCKRAPAQRLGRVKVRCAPQEVRGPRVRPTVGKASKAAQKRSSFLRKYGQAAGRESVRGTCAQGVHGFE